MKKLLKKHYLILAILCISLILTACATQPPSSEVVSPAGFIKGFFNGFCILFSLIGSLFMDIRIYSFPNSGFFYDLGFFLGASCFLGGSSAGACKAKK
jgi:hypothetical protein